MKIAVSATGGSKAAKVESRFGRCAYFVIVDSETMKFTAFTNPAGNAPGGAGPAAVQEIHKHGAEVVLTGQVGPQAERALQAADIKIVTNAGGTVEEAVKTYLSTGA
ncbi:dinitrogenase iron-molybdenum cofactor biosynthesis protein [candidate division KSB1 bacterium]|nr:dinitrogenase iron-molybdenum cofactor biosynthesis protein [candidate division KSB1 bacterium]